MENVRSLTRLPPAFQSALATSLLLLLVNAVAPVSLAIGAQPPPVVEEPGVSGYVLAPDGTPVSGGTVVARSGIVSTRASIDSTGRFRLVPMRSGSHQFLVSVPGLAPYRVIVTGPDSRSLRLPVIRLTLGAYFRVRLVSPAGEPIIAPQLRRRLFDVSGKSIFDGLSDRISDPADNDGAITIGPLPRGIMTVAVDMPLFAQTRLPDLNFSDATKTVDGGTIAIQQPGAVLHIDVLDGTGAPVPNHEVHIDDPRPRSPLVFRPVRTNQQGRATFDRLAAGQYRVSTTAADRCANVLLTTSRVVAVAGSGARVEATATASGEALLEGVGTAGGTLAASAHGYEPAQEQLTEPPGVPHTIALMPVPPTPNVRPRVITTSGEPLRNAVVELISANPAEVPRVAVTDAKGVVTFSDVPSGSLQLIASADGFPTSTQRIEEDRTTEVVVTLSRGYRVIASVELPATAGPQLVRVVNDGNASIDSFLDGESDRRVESTGRLSLGPLAPGAYVIELHGAGGRRSERIRIIDRDVCATFR